MSITKRRLREYHQCHKKLRHPHFLSAMRHAQSLQRKRTDVLFSPYQCEYCGYNHVGRINHYSKLVHDLKAIRAITSKPEFQQKAADHAKQKLAEVEQVIVEQLSLLSNPLVDEFL